MGGGRKNGGGGCEAALDPAAAPWGHLGGVPRATSLHKKPLAPLGRGGGGHRDPPPHQGPPPPLGASSTQPWGGPPPALGGTEEPPPTAWCCATPPKKGHGELGGGNKGQYFGGGVPLQPPPLQITGLGEGWGRGGGRLWRAPSCQQRARRAWRGGGLTGKSHRQRGAPPPASFPPPHPMHAPMHPAAASAPGALGSRGGGA